MLQSADDKKKKSKFEVATKNTWLPFNLGGTDSNIWLDDLSDLKVEIGFIKCDELGVLLSTKVKLEAQWLKKDYHHNSC